MKPLALFVLALTPFVALAEKKAHLLYDDAGNQHRPRVIMPPSSYGSVSPAPAASAPAASAPAASAPAASAPAATAPAATAPAATAPAATAPAATAPAATAPSASAPSSSGNGNGNGNGKSGEHSNHSGQADGTNPGNTTQNNGGTDNPGGRK